MSMKCRSMLCDICYVYEISEYLQSAAEAAIMLDTRWKTGKLLIYADLSTSGLRDSNRERDVRDVQLETLTAI